jgi:hypothetical protein
MQAAKGIWPIYKEPDQVSGFFHFGNVLFTKRSQNGAQIEHTKGFDPKQ